MYRVLDDVRDFLVKHTKAYDIPGIVKDSINPFVIRNKKAIGLGDSFRIVGGDCDYLLLSDYSLPATEEFEAYQPPASGTWLLKRDELKRPSEPVILKRVYLDQNCVNPEEEIDISDCCIIPPSAIDRMTCLTITSVKRLFELEPGIKECLQGIDHE